MTEPDVASSDATNICTNAVLDGEEWVINGEKHWTSGAGDPRCKVMICMVKTDTDAPKHLQQSQILVPLDAPGVEIVRPLTVFNNVDAPHGHMRVKLNDVRVPKENIILGPGRGFEISQGSSWPGSYSPLHALYWLLRRRRWTFCAHVQRREPLLGDRSQSLAAILTSLPMHV